MTDLDGLLAGFDGMIEQVTAKVAEEMQITASTGLAVLVDRVTQTGKNAEGGDFKPYTPAYELRKRGGSSARLTKKKRTQRATADQPVGRYKGFVDFTFTGRMFDNIGIIEQRAEGGRFVVRVGARSDENRLKMIGNDAHRPKWFTLSVKEQEKLAEQSAVHMGAFAQKFLAR